eukprot:gnl/TRDRNA2_/TRDRNA2_71091_c0_seq1.p1 gnl/TRDRNA2_/TRDRNA2_71091_c0~~gnl/TRDRNA2_/TRDRNA2_71091_c0_seq1.p1  ORF type:complete len:382 (-),score=78.47 gnl/TRDRNA2_/TRDRNA2_71091_c0_seq1:22-1167(-)
MYIRSTMGRQRLCRLKCIGQPARAIVWGCVCFSCVCFSCAEGTPTEETLEPSCPAGAADCSADKFPEEGCRLVKLSLVNQTTRGEVTFKAALATHAKATLEAIRKFPSLLEVQEECCGALRNLAAEGVEVQRHIAELKGIQTLVKVMKKHPKSLKLQEEGCGALANLAGEDQDIQAKIAVFGGVERVTKAMERHPYAVNVQSICCNAVVNLANDAPNQAKFVSQGALPLIVTAMARHLEDADMQRLACSAISQLTRDQYDNMAEAGKHGGVEAVLKAMTKHSNVSQVQEQCVPALRNLAADDRSREVMIEAGVIKTLLKIMKKHPEVQDVAEEGCYALYMIAGMSSENRKKIVSLGAVELVQKLEKKFPVAARALLDVLRS